MVELLLSSGEKAEIYIVIFFLTWPSWLQVLFIFFYVYAFFASAFVCVSVSGFCWSICFSAPAQYVDAELNYIFLYINYTPTICPPHAAFCSSFMPTATEWWIRYNQSLNVKRGTGEKKKKTVAEFQRIFQSVYFLFNQV